MTDGADEERSTITTSPVKIFLSIMQSPARRHRNVAVGFWVST
jgi:hypothetical protein